MDVHIATICVPDDRLRGRGRGRVGFFDREIVEHAIAHRLKDKAEAAYQRGTMLMKRAHIMQEWGRFCRTREFHPAEILTRIHKAA